MENQVLRLGTVDGVGNPGAAARRRHLNLSSRRGKELSDTDSYDEYTVSGSEMTVQRTPRKRRNSTSRRNTKRRTRNGPLSYGLLFLGGTIKTLIILPLMDALGSVVFYILSTLLIVALVILTITSLPVLLPKLFAFLIPRAVYLPSSVLRGLNEVSNFPTALGNTYCSTIGFGCHNRGQSYEEMIGNLTYSATSQVRQASKVITSLNNLDTISNSLALDSVKIHSLGDATMYLSNFPDREIISSQLYKLSKGVKTMGRKTSRLQVHGKNSMDIIVGLYEQLGTKLEGSRGPPRQRKYTPESVTQAKDQLHRELESILRELQAQIQDGIQSSDEIIDTANRLGGMVTNSQSSLQESQQLSRKNWISTLSDTIKWNDLSRIQKENVQRDIKLLDHTLSVTERTKEGLLVLSNHLVGFEEAVESARRRNDKSVILGLDTEDLLRIYRESLVSSRKEIDGWS